MPCLKARSITSSGSTPTATPTLPRSWTATAAWSPSWRSQAVRQGCGTLLRFVAERTADRRCWALEGTGCNGAGLASFLADQGEWVVEVDRPKRPRGRNGAKSDPLDAIRAGREALSREHLACPRQHGHREALRVLQLTRSGAVDAIEPQFRPLQQAELIYLGTNAGAYVLYDGTARQAVLIPSGSVALRFDPTPD